MSCFFGHKFGIWITDSSSCYIAQSRTCSNCGKIETHSAGENHSYSGGKINNLSCIITQKMTCSKCGKIKINEIEERHSYTQRIISTEKCHFESRKWQCAEHYDTEEGDKIVVVIENKCKKCGYIKITEN